ncbi:insulinase family protein [bacterium]|nr:insulinase family protein [bacterium]
MIKRTLLLALAILFVTSASFAEQPVRSMTLPNGLDLVMMPDGSTPLLSSLLIVRAGSGNETLATAGATHLLEHMIFRGTTTRSQDEIYDSFDRMGAYYNAQTSKTYTNFILVTPVEHSLDAMDIQADMILNSVINPDTLVIEKGRVINEIKQGLERSSTRAEDIHLRNAYAPSSYGFSTIGTIEGINAIPAESVQQFHDDWYVVNNMTLVLRGDLSFAEMEALAEEIYGGLVPKDLPERPEAWPVGLDDWRRNQLHVSYGASRSGSITMTINAPRHDALDMPAYSALTLLLDDELTERLQGGGMPLVTYVYSSIDHDPDFSVLNINAGLMPGTDPQVVADQMLAAVRALAPGEMTMTKIREALRDERRSELFFAEQVQYGSFLLVPKLAVAPWGFWDGFEEARDNLTAEDLDTAYRFWFENPIWLATAYLPDEEETDSGSMSIGPITDQELANGMRVVARELDGAPVAGIHLAIAGRSAWEDDEKRGWVDLLHRLLLSGENAETFDQRMSEIGMEMDVVDDPRVPMDNYRTVPEYSFVRIQVVSENWAEAVEFLAERLGDASFTDEDIATAAQEQLSISEREGGGVRSETVSRFNDLLYGENVRRAPIYGDSTSLTDIDAKELRAFRKEVFATGNLVLSVIAPAPAAQIVEVCETAFRGLPSTSAMLPLSEPAMASPGVDTVRATGQQGYLATGFLLEQLPLDQHAAALLANVMVSDRIYRDLGEKKGWAYGAGSSLLMRDGWGAWISRVALPEEHLEEARTAVYEHLAAVANGDFDADRLEIARNDMRGSMLRRYSSRINLAMALGTDAVMYNEPNQTWLLYDQLGNVTLEDVKQAAFDLFSQPDGVVTVFGMPEGEMQMPKGMPPGMGGMGGMGH